MTKSNRTRVIWPFVLILRVGPTKFFSEQGPPHFVNPALRVSCCIEYNCTEVHGGCNDALSRHRYRATYTDHRLHHRYRLYTYYFWFVSIHCSHIVVFKRGPKEEKSGRARRRRTRRYIVSQLVSTRI